MTRDELHAAAKTSGFSISPDSQDETDFLLLANSFDAVAASVASIPDYIDPRLEPVEVEGGVRKFSKPAPQDNLMNAWSHKVELTGRERRDVRVSNMHCRPF